MINSSLNRQTFIAWVVIVLFIVAGSIKASNIEGLIGSNKFLLTVSVQDNSEPIVKQQIVIELEVASKYSFAKPIKYIRPKVNNTAESPRKSPGFTNSKMVNGESWNSQVKEFALYPIKEGRYHIPQIEVHVAIYAENDEVIETTLFTKPYDFEVKLPKELVDRDNFVISNQVEIVITNEGSETEIFSIGDAYTQTVTVSASDIAGMLLPDTLSQKIEGVSIYRKPPRLSDKTNRGLLTGKRIDSVTYIFEQAGEYHIEEEIVYWWNPDEQELTELIIPAKTFVVEGGALSQSATPSNRSSNNVTYENTAAFVLLILFSFAFYKGYQWRSYLFRLYSKLTNLKQRKIKAGIIMAVQEHKYLYACQLLYDFINCHSPSACTLRQYFSESSDNTNTLNKLLILAYSDNISDENIQIQSSEIKRLLNRSVRNFRKHVFFDKNIQLNPLD